jgi:hypothetical protein
MFELKGFAPILALVVWASFACSQREPAVDYLAERSQYLEVANARTKVSGTDPVQTASELFGAQDRPTEGNFKEEIVLSSQDEQTTVVLVTQTGLADDSIEGIRYRLEFTAEGDEWQLNWVGQQMRCRQGRGPQEWATETCS